MVTKDTRILHGYHTTIVLLMEDTKRAMVAVIEPNTTHSKILYHGCDLKRAADWYMHPFACGYNYKEASNG